MLSFINDFQATIAGDLAGSDTELPLSPADIARLDFSGGQEYLLTLADSLDPSARTMTEIVRVSAGLAIERGQEGTTPHSWPAGTPVMCSITAGGLAEIAGSGGGGGGGGVTISNMPPLDAPAAAGLMWLYTNGPDQALYCATGASSPHDWARIWPREYGAVWRIDPAHSTIFSPGPADTLIVDMAGGVDGVVIAIEVPEVDSERGWRLVIDYRDHGVTSWFPLILPGSPSIHDLVIYLDTNRHYGISIDESSDGRPELALWDGTGRPTVIEVIPSTRPGKTYQINISSLRGSQELWQPAVQG